MLRRAESVPGLPKGRCRMQIASADRASSQGVSSAAEMASWPGRLHAGGSYAHSARVLVVESDPDTRRLVVDSLQRHGVDVALAYARQDDVGKELARDPSLVVLDLGAADKGFELLRMVRSRSDVPIIVTSGLWRDEVDRVLGLELGADDYLAKPYGVRELAARIRAMLRRQRNERATPPARSERGGYEFNGWKLERSTRRLINPEGAPVRLTKGEYALLTALLDSALRPLTREYLLRATSMREDVFDRSINVRILRLRRKLEPSPGTPHVIRTLRGVGYVFALPVERF
jgi:two-component system, OmpR family, response regulator